MSGVKFEYKLSQIERTVLEYIADHPFCLLKDIVKSIYNSNDKKVRSSVYKYLGKFKRLHLINSVPLDESQGTRSVLCFYILSHGSWALGRRHAPVSKSRSSIEATRKREVKNIVQKICKKQNARLYEGNDKCKDAIAAYLLLLDKLSGTTVQTFEYYQSKAPQKIAPDMLIATKGELALIIISDIRAGIMAFCQRIKRYQDILPMMRCFVICMSEEQKKDWLKILNNRQPRFLSFEIKEKARNFQIFTYDEVPNIETHLQRS